MSYTPLTGLWQFGSFTIPAIDLIALLWFFIAWMSYAYYADHVHHGRVSLLTVMGKYRLEWMRAMLRREQRIMDITLSGNLQRSISFFASTSIFILLGAVTLLGYREQAIEIFSTLPFAAKTPTLVWDLKIMLLIIIFIYAFFKYTWSLRQYNYAGIFIAAAPMPGEHPEHHEDYAQRGATIVSNAARHFNMGLRSYYFGLAALSWFINPGLFLFATTWVVYVLFRREFRSHTLGNLQEATLLKS